jgi:cytochrome c5
MQKLADWLEKLGMSRRCRDRRHEQRPQVAGNPDGETVYRERCAQCHAGAVVRAPDAAALRQLMRAKIAVL